MTNLAFVDKDPDEVLVLTIPFSQDLNGETIQSAAWTIEKELPSATGGTYEDHPEMLSGAADITSAPLVRQKVTGGIHGATYLHRAKVVTSDGRTLVIGARQRVLRGA